MTQGHRSQNRVHRYYDPQTGQFLTIDPLIDTTGTAYAYGADDPVLTADPSGLCAASAGRFMAFNRTPGSQTQPGGSRIGLGLAAGKGAQSDDELQKREPDCEWGHGIIARIGDEWVTNASLDCGHDPGVTRIQIWAQLSRGNPATDIGTRFAAVDAKVAWRRDKPIASAWAQVVFLGETIELQGPVWPKPAPGEIA